MARARIIDSAELAQYLGFDGDSGAMTRWLRDELGVKPMAGRRGKWDRRAIDAALDRASGLESGAKPSEPADPYLAWCERVGEAP
ncbi:MAG: hypothetical protein AAGM38_15910 [Pseudomonadota bacterium]